MNLRPVYRMYVDEVGNPSTANLEHPENRYFSLTGVVVELKHESVIATDMKALKLKYFGSDAVVLHRNDIERHGDAFKVLYDPQIESAFNRELLASMERWEYAVFTVCLDKHSLYQKKALAQNPYLQCMAALLDQYASFLANIGSRGDVMMESRGKGEDKAIEKEFTHLWTAGARGRRFQSVLTSKRLKIRLKLSNEPGLQIADLVAYPSQLYTTRHRVPLFSVSGITNLTQNLIQLIPMKYYQQSGVIQGVLFLE